MNICNATPLVSQRARGTCLLYHRFRAGQIVTSYSKILNGDLHQQFINLPGRSCSYWCQASRLPESAWLQNDPERIICHLMQSSCIQASVLYTVFEMDPGILSVHCPAEPRRAHRCHSSHSSRPSQSPLSDTEFHTVCATASPSSRPILVAATVTFIAVVYTQIE